MQDLYVPFQPGDGQSAMGILLPTPPPIPRPVAVASVACLFCKKRKIACSGEYPCSQCTKRSIDCIYPIAHSKRGPKLKRAHPAKQNNLARISADGPLVDAALLIQQLANLRLQLDVERRLAEHWRDQFYTSQSDTSLFSPTEKNLTPFNRPRGYPKYSDATSAFLEDTAAALAATVGAFRAGYEIVQKKISLNFDADAATRFWTQFTTYLPEDFRVAMRVREESHLVLALEYAAMFTHGAEGLDILDLAGQLGSIGLELVQILMFDKQAATKIEYAPRLASAFVALADFCKHTNRKSAQIALMNMCEQILIKFPNETDNSRLVMQTYSHHAATATDEPSRQYWISRLLFYAAKNGGPVDQRFFSLFVLIDNGLHIGDNAPPRLQEWMRDIEFAEDQIDQHGKSVPIEYRLDVVKFYKLWFCGLKAEIMQRLGRGDDSRKLLVEGTTLYHSIKNHTLKTVLLGVAKICSAHTSSPLPMLIKFANALRASAADPCFANTFYSQYNIPSPEEPSTLAEPSAHPAAPFDLNDVNLAATIAGPNEFIHPMSPRFYDLSAPDPSDQQPMLVVDYVANPAEMEEDNISIDSLLGTSSEEAETIHSSAGPSPSGFMMESNMMSNMMDSSDTYVFSNPLSQSGNFPQDMFPQQLQDY